MLPEILVVLLPECLIIFAPHEEARIAAKVEMLKVLVLSPPVPQVSTASFEISF